MDPREQNIEVLRAKMHALLAYSAYLKLMRRCGVVFVPVHGWVA